MKNLIFIFSLLITNILFPINIPKISLTNNTKTVLKNAVILTACYYGYIYGKKTYNYINNKIDEKCEKEVVRFIELQFKLNPQCNDQELKDKAWSVNIRKCVIEKLEQIKPEDSRWSQNFQDEFNRLKKTFETFDNVRGTFNNLTRGVFANNREQEYDKPYEELSYLDKYLIYIIVNNTLLKYKPDNICDQSEIDKKMQMQESSKRINKALKNDVASLAAKAAISTAAGAFMTFII